MGSQYRLIGMIYEKMGKRHRVGSSRQTNNHPALLWKHTERSDYPFDLFKNLLHVLIHGAAPPAR